MTFHGNAKLISKLFPESHLKVLRLLPIKTCVSENIHVNFIFCSFLVSRKVATDKNLVSLFHMLCRFPFSTHHFLWSSTPREILELFNMPSKKPFRIQKTSTGLFWAWYRPAVASVTSVWKNYREWRETDFCDCFIQTAEKVFFCILCIYLQKRWKRFSARARHKLEWKGAL